MSRHHFRLASSDKRPIAVFLPGWAFDGRICLSIPFTGSFLYPESFLEPETLAHDLAAALDARRMTSVAIVGWSMGGFIALDFARQYPERVRSVVLIGMRHYWPPADIAAIREGLLQDRNAFLTDFYRKCFLGNRRSYIDFVSTLQPDYIEHADTELLLRGLSYLDGKKLLPVADLPVRLIHGRRDIIAPPPEQLLPAGLELQIIEHGSHMPFLAPEFPSLAELL